MEDSDLIHVAGMATLYGLYRLDLWRRSYRASDWVAECRRKLRGD